MRIIDFLAFCTKTRHYTVDIDAQKYTPTGTISLGITPVTGYSSLSALLIISITSFAINGFRITPLAPILVANLTSSS